MALLKPKEEKMAKAESKKKTGQKTTAYQNLILVRQYRQY